MLGVDREGEDMPCIQRLVVGRGEMERGYLVLLRGEQQLVIALHICQLVDER